MEEKVLLRADLQAMVNLLAMDPRILRVITTKVEERVRSLLSLDTEVEAKTVAKVTTQTSAIPTILLLLEATVPR